MKNTWESDVFSTGANPIIGHSCYDIDYIACIIIQATVKIGSIYLEKSDVVLFINVSEGYEKKTAKTDKRGQKRRA